MGHSLPKSEAFSCGPINSGSALKAVYSLGMYRYIKIVTQRNTNTKKYKWHGTQAIHKTYL